MKIDWINNLGKLIVGISILLMIGCESAKYTTDFKKQKKQIDTLTVIIPFTYVAAVSFRTGYFDSLLTTVNQELIEKTTLNILSSRYAIEKTYLPKIDLRTLDEIYSQIENSPKTLSGIHSKTLLTEIEHNNNRYAVLIIYNGQINPDFPPHSNFKTDSFIINMTTEPFSDLRLMIIDTEKEEVVYFDRILSINIDPRVESEIKQMTADILRKI